MNKQKMCFYYTSCPTLATRSCIFHNFFVHLTESILLPYQNPNGVLKVSVTMSVCVICYYNNIFALSSKLECTCNYLCISISNCMIIARLFEYEVSFNLPCFSLYFTIVKAPFLLLPCTGFTFTKHYLQIIEQSSQN